MFFEKVFRKLNEYDVKYLVIGGVAVNLYGFIRATNDLDMFIFLDEKNVENFSVAMKELNFVPKIPVNIVDLSNTSLVNSWINEKNMKVFSLINLDTDEVIDVMVMKYIDFEEAYKNKTTIKIKEMELPIVSLNDLIKLKEISGRPQDIMDIKMLSKIKEQEK